jgi:hypothetical protein
MWFWVAAMQGVRTAAVHPARGGQRNSGAGQSLRQPQFILNGYLARHQQHTFSEEKITVNDADKDAAMDRHNTLRDFPAGCASPLCCSPAQRNPVRSLPG